jgi:hypothetical protein
LARFRNRAAAHPRLGALLDAATHGLRTLPQMHLERLPRMADFVLWATACETALWPAGTFARAYAENRSAAVDRVIDADPVADAVRAIMSDRITWTGTASDLLSAAADLAGDDMAPRSAGWPKHPRTLAGRLRRAQAFLRTLGIEIAFSREGQAGRRMIRLSAAREYSHSNIARTVSNVRNNGSRSASRKLRMSENGRSPRDRC